MYKSGEVLSAQSHQSAGLESIADESVGTATIAAEHVNALMLANNVVVDLGAFSADAGMAGHMAQRFGDGSVAADGDPMQIAAHAFSQAGVDLGSAVNSLGAAAGDVATGAGKTIGYDVSLVGAGLGGHVADQASTVGDAMTFVGNEYGDHGTGNEGTDLSNAGQFVTDAGAMVGVGLAALGAAAGNAVSTGAATLGAAVTGAIQAVGDAIVDAANKLGGQDQTSGKTDGQGQNTTTTTDGVKQTDDPNNQQHDNGNNTNNNNGNDNNNDNNGDHKTDDNTTDTKQPTTADDTTPAGPTPEGSTPNPDGDDDGNGGKHLPSIGNPSASSLSEKLAAIGNSQDGSSNDGSHGPHDPGEEMPNPEGGGNSPTSNVAHSGSFWDQAAAATQGATAGLHLSASADSGVASLNLAVTATSAHDISGAHSDTSAHTEVSAHDMGLAGASLHAELGTATFHDALALSAGTFAHQMHV